MNYTGAFNVINPDFFQKKNIRSIPKEQVYTELVMDLRKDAPKKTSFDFPVTFGEYGGEIPALREAVRAVDEDWVQWFNEKDRVFCAFYNGKIAAFCLLSDMGEFEGIRIGGPGCVGTVPEYRRRGIGLEMVRLATEKLKEEGYDLSWIHYTHIGDWYMKLGYKPVLKWNSGGIIGNG